MTTVWIGIYEHKYGADVGAYATEALANEGLATTAIEQLDDDPHFELNEDPEDDDAAEKEFRRRVIEIRTAFAERRWTDVIVEYLYLANEECGLSESMDVQQATLTEGGGYR